MLYAFSTATSTCLVQATTPMPVLFEKHHMTLMKFQGASLSWLVLCLF